LETSACKSSEKEVKMRFEGKVAIVTGAASGMELIRQGGIHNRNKLHY